MNTPSNDAKELFRKCGACSHTFAYIINREYEHQDPLHEKALDTLAGGIFREGHQCGMLWGAAMAAGAEAYRRTDDIHEAEAMALAAAQQLVKSFEDQEHTIECREITGVRMNRLAGLLKFMMKTMITGMNKSKCFEMAEDWAPEAIKSAETGLSSQKGLDPPAYNCAAITARKLGASEEEAVMAAGFAGGLGLSGKGCGALAVAVWMKTLAWLREHPGKTAPMFRYPELSKLIDDFKSHTEGSMRCEEICKIKFQTAEEHAEYIKDGGCNDLMQMFEHSVLQ